MALRRPRIKLVLDFDGTITIDDTTAVIGARCLEKARELARADVNQDDLPQAMQHYSQQYMHDYREWKQTATWPSERKTIDDEVGYLSQSRHVERASYLRVKTAVLRVPGKIEELQQNETTRNEFMTDAGRQAVRSGEIRIRDSESLRSLITKAEQEGNTWGIVSVSWSRRFILGALIEAGLVKEERSDDIAQRIKCNELLTPDNLDGEGQVNVICSARDKLEAFHELLEGWDALDDAQENQHPISSRDNQAVITMYVGDSSTDLGCLAGPAIGVYLQKDRADEDPVVQSLKRLGVECVHIDDLPTADAPSQLREMISDLQERGKPPHIVCLVQSFQEIDQWVSRVLKDSG